LICNHPDIAFGFPVRLITLLVLLSWLLSAVASPVPTLWQNNVPSGHRLISTPDGGALVLGVKTITMFDSDAQFTRIDSNGAILWSKSYGGSGIDQLLRGVQLPNGDFILLGESWSDPSGTKISPAYGNDDFWLMRISSGGELIWERSWGGSDRDLAVSLLVTNDFILLFGNSSSPASGNKTAPRGGAVDYVVVKFNLAGELQWDKAFGLEGHEWLVNVLHDKASNRIFLVGDSARPPDQPPRDLFSFPSLNFSWVVCIDSNGQQLWQKSYTDTGFEITKAATFLGDGSLAVGGVWVNNDIVTPFVTKIDPADGHAYWRKIMGAHYDFTAFAPAAQPGSVVVATSFERPRPGSDYENTSYYIDEIDGSEESIRSSQIAGFGEAQTFASKLYHLPGRAYFFATTVQSYSPATGYGIGGDVLLWWLNENLETIGTNVIGGDQMEILNDLTFTSTGDILASALSDSDRSQTKTVPRPPYDGNPPPHWIFKLPGSFVPNPPQTEIFIEPAALRATQDATSLVLRAATPAQFILEYTDDFVTWHALQTFQLSVEPFHTSDPTKSALRFYRLRSP
jgi:hypothetical protein